MGEIDDLRSELEKLSPLCDEAQEITQRTQEINDSMERILSRVTRSGILEPEISVAKQKLWVRLAMALGGRTRDWSRSDGDHGLAPYMDCQLDYYDLLRLGGCR